MNPLGDSLQQTAVPLRERGSCFIGALQKGEQGLIGRRFLAQIFIKQDELTQLFVVGCAPRLTRCTLKTLRRRSRIAIEGSFTETTVAWPEAGADYFTGVSLAGNGV